VSSAKQKATRISMISAHIFHCGASPINGREVLCFPFSRSFSFLQQSSQLSALRSARSLASTQRASSCLFRTHTSQKTVHAAGAGVTPARENAFLRCRFLFLSLARGEIPVKVFIFHHAMSLKLFPHMDMYVKRRVPAFFFLSLSHTHKRGRWL
jgi:hypothetical protein